MRAVISRVLSASVTVDAAVVAELRDAGLLVLLGVGAADTVEDAALMARKIAELRLLRAERSVLDAGASVLVVSQFTLYGDTRKGRRPSLSGAAHPEIASPLVDAVLTALRARGVRTLCGRFRRRDGRDLRQRRTVHRAGGHLRNLLRNFSVGMRRIARSRRVE